MHMTWHVHIDSYSIQVVQSTMIIMINLRHAMYYFFIVHYAAICLALACSEALF